MEWEEVINEFANRLLYAVETARGDIRSLARQASEAVGSGEASILVPTDDKAHLSFLVSLNDSLDNSDMQISLSESISGFVFESGQVVAKVKPESAGASEVNEAAGVQTEYLLAVPVMSEDRVIAVATFVNRAENAPEAGFDRNEIEIAQQYAELYAIALKIHRRTVLAYRLASRELIALNDDIGTESADLGMLQKQHRMVPGMEEGMEALAEQLSGRDRKTLERFGRFLLNDDSDE